MNIAIVTGASSGMGREFVLQLPQYVAVDEIWVIARREAALESLKSECSVTVRPIALDLCENSSFDTFRGLLETEKPNVKLTSCSWTACPPSSLCLTSPPTVPPNPLSSATAAP